MSYAYDYRAGPSLGALTSLTDYCDPQLPETSPGRRAVSRVVKWKQGARAQRPKFWDPVRLDLDTLIRWTDPAGLITAGNGEAEHFQENLAGLKALFLPDTGLVYFVRDDPEWGAQFRVVEVDDPIRLGSPRNRYRWELLSPWPFWKDAGTASTSTDTFTGDGTLQVIVGGAVPIYDALITVDADTQPVTNVQVEVPGTGRFVRYGATLAAGDTVTFDIGAKEYLLNGTTRVDAAIAKDFADVFVLPVGTTDLDVTSDAGTLDYDVTVTWRDQTR